MLPGPLSRAVAVAYLVCRVADTIEDDSTIAVPRRRELLTTWRTAVQTGEPVRLPDDAVGRSADEHAVIGIADSVCRELHRLPAADLHAVERYAVEMIDGMSVSLAPRSDSTTPLFATQAELERYCYYVAGTVGLMLTDLYQNHAPSIRGEPLATLRRHAVNFGLGLQLTNVIRDVGNDLGEGRVYFPAASWHEAGITPREFFASGRDAASWAVVRPLLAACRPDAGRCTGVLDGRATPGLPDPVVLRRPAVLRGANAGPGQAQCGPWHRKHNGEDAAS